LQIKFSLLKHSLILISLLTILIPLSISSTNEYDAYASKNSNNDDSDEIQWGSQNSECEAGEDNNNSCNNISISRQGGGSSGGQGNTVQVSKQNSECEAGEDNNNSCNNFNIQNIIESKLKLISQTRQ